MDAIIGVLGTLIGTVIGYLLSEWSTIRKEKREDRKHAKSVRVIVGLEIDHNIHTLVEFLGRVDEVIRKMADNDYTQVGLRAFQFIFDLPFSPLLSKGFDSQLPIMTGVLDEREVASVLEFYNDLEKLHGLHHEMTEMNDGQIISLAPKMWEEWNAMATRLIETGNPIKHK